MSAPLPRALVINLVRATARLDFMARQMDLLGLAWERVEAVTPETMRPPPDDPVWQRWQRPLRETEMAGLASHLMAWRSVAEGTAPVLILEDDALLAVETAEHLSRWAGAGDMDHLSLETRGRLKTLGPAKGGRARLWQDRSGAAAYLLWPDGARRLIRAATAAPGLADAIICAAYDLRSFQAEPALAIQLDQCAAHGITPPLATTSQIDALAKPVRGGLGFRARRALAQLRMARRQFRVMGGATRRLVPPSDGIAKMAARVSHQATGQGTGQGAETDV
ncbi:MAG: glycosyltransferase family 25 protein [Pseudomonadota bacterium]